MNIDLGEVFAHTPGLLFVADADGKLLHHSEALAHRFGPEERASLEGFLAELARSDERMNRVLQLSGPGGAQTAVRCTARRAPDGSIHGQLEIEGDTPGPADALRIERALFRAVMNTLDIVLWAIDSEGNFVFHDGKALATAGLTPGQFLGMNIYELYPPELVKGIRKAGEGIPSTDSSEVHGVHWRTWNIPIQSRGGDETDFVAGLSVDITAEVRSKLELERRLATIQEQQRAILELSAPIINVWDSVLCVPLIGVMDNDRANELIERLLGEASRSSTRYVILDLTGIDALDTSIAGHLLRLLRSLKLLGVEGLVTGISPQVAQTMVGLGVELEDVQTFRSLRESLRFCMRTMYEERATTD
jgi:rsbT co-antagonist protein RsbR